MKIVRIQSKHDYDGFCWYWNIIRAIQNVFQYRNQNIVLSLSILIITVYKLYVFEFQSYRMATDGVLKEYLNHV